MTYEYIPNSLAKQMFNLCAKTQSYQGEYVSNLLADTLGQENWQKWLLPHQDIFYHDQNTVGNIYMSSVLHNESTADEIAKAVPISIGTIRLIQK